MKRFRSVSFVSSGFRSTSPLAYFKSKVRYAYWSFNTGFSFKVSFPRTNCMYLNISSRAESFKKRRQKLGENWFGLLWREFLDWGAFQRAKNAKTIKP